MSEPDYEEMRRLLTTRTVVDQLPNGTWRTRRRGVTGIGKDHYYAVHDLIRKERLLFDPIRLRCPRNGTVTVETVGSVPANQWRLRAGRRRSDVDGFHSGGFPRHCLQRRA